MHKEKNGSCIVTFRVDEETGILIEKLKEETGLSIREILGYSAKTCECCKDTAVVAYNSKDKNVKIPKGILFKSLLRKNSTYDTSRRTGKIDK
jgi:hypothetical protein